MKKYLLPLICLSLLVFSSLVSAETKTFVKEYSYQASEYDSKVSCRALALEQVKRLLLEELGTYLESETEVKNFQLTKDQIVILTAGIVSTEIIDEKWDGKIYFLKAKITADPKDVASSIDKLRQDRQKTKELEETRKKADEALRAVERLRQELEIAKAEKPNLSQYNKAVNALSAIDWFERGLASSTAGKYQEAIEAYSKAIELDPKDAMAYVARGFAYDNLGDDRQGIKDYDRAIELDPKLAVAYFARGVAYDNLEDYRQAIRDFDRAIELNLKDAVTYSSRGSAYGKLRNYRQAIRDYDRAIELNPKFAEAFSNRGFAYGHLEDYRQAIWDFDRAIELDPKFAGAFAGLGGVYAILGNTEQAIKNLTIAARLGHNRAQDYLRSKGIEW
jgi:tetratricopeptide (TPR) repeat protein